MVLSGRPALSRSALAVVASSVMVLGLLVGVGQVTAAAEVTSVKGSACGYYVNVGLFGGPQGLTGCGQDASQPATAASPAVTLPAGGSATPVTAADPDGAKAVYGPSTIFGGRWTEDLAVAPPSGPISVSTQGTPGGGVTSSADIVLDGAAGSETGDDGPGGFGPFPVEGDSLHVECSASESGVTGSTTFSNAVLATATDGEGNPTVTEPVPDTPPVNYTRSGVITNVGDVFTVVYNEQIVNPDGSLTVNAAHMYLFGPTAVGEVVKGQVTCGTTPPATAPEDTVAPTCGTAVVMPMGPTDPTPRDPREELVGVFDAGGLQSITNVQVTNGTVRVGDPGSAYDHLKFVPGQTGPLPITATRTGSSALHWSFDATDAAGNTTHCEGVEAPPVAVADVYYATRNLTLTVAAPGVLGNDTDGNGDTLTAGSASTPANGSVTLNPDGSFTYTPATDFLGTDNFTYETSDGRGPAVTGSVTINVTPYLDPVAADDAYATDEDIVLTVPAPGLLANDSDPDGGRLGVRQPSDPPHGRVVLDGDDGGFSYTPDLNFVGTDSFTYLLDDNQADYGSETATVTITVAAVNDAPVAGDENYRTDEDTPLTTPAPGVLANDTDVEGDALGVGSASDPANGTVVLNADGSFTYTPDAGFGGLDPFTYEVSDANGGTDTGTVMMIVGPFDGVTTVSGGAFGYYSSVCFNFGHGCGPPDVDGPAPTVTLSSAGGSETATAPSGKAEAGPAVFFESGPITVHTEGGPGPDGSSTSSVSIIQDKGGVDPFYFATIDSTCTSNRTGTTGSARLTGGNLNRGNGDWVALPDNPAPNTEYFGSIDGVGDQFRIVLNEQIVTSDSIIVNAVHMYLLGYTANGDMIAGQSRCGVAATTPNQAPTAAGDAYSVEGGSALAVPAPGVLANDADPDGNPLTAYGYRSPRNGTVNVRLDGSFFYVPNTGFSGTDSFIYQARDPRGGSATATVTITVAPAPSELENDNFADAKAISGQAGRITRSNVDATTEPGEPTWGQTIFGPPGEPFSGGHTIWYQWTAPVNAEATFDLCTSDFYPVVGVYTGGSLETLTEVASSNGSFLCPDGSSTAGVRFGAKAGTVYSIIVASAWEGTFGNAVLSWSTVLAPPNDNFVDAQVISGSTGSVAGTSLGASTENGEPYHQGARSVWYRWTAPATGQVLFDTCETNFRPVVDVYKGTSVKALTEVYAPELYDCLPSGSGYGSRQVLNVTAGTIYHIVVDSNEYETPAGNFTLKWKPIFNRISINDVSVAEGNDGTTEATFTVTRSGDALGETVVPYRTTDGSGKAPDDYAAVPANGGAVQLYSGERSRTVTVPVTGDTIAEANETFNVVLSNPLNGSGTLSDGTGVATIMNDDAPAYLSIDNVAVSEGNSGPTAATFTVSRSGNTTGASTVKYKTGGGTATAGTDYTAAALDVLSFAAGETSKTVTVDVLGDLDAENNETFNLALSAPTGAVLADTSGTTTIVDDEGPIAPAPKTFLSIGSLAVNEGDSATTPATFTVTRSGDTSGTTTVKYKTSGGTAIAGTDYTAAGLETLSFGAGETSKSVDVAVTGDTLPEVNETLNLVLSGPMGAVIADAAGTATMVNDDAPANLSVDDVSVNEGSSGTTTATFTVTRSGNTTGASTVKYKTADGTAITGTDYTGRALTEISFAAGETTKTITVDITGDTSDEKYETFRVVLSAATGAVISDASGTATIVDDD